MLSPLPAPQTNPAKRATGTNRPSPAWPGSECLCEPMLTRTVLYLDRVSQVALARSQDKQLIPGEHPSIRGGTWWEMWCSLAARSDVPYYSFWSSGTSSGLKFREIWLACSVLSE